MPIRPNVIVVCLGVVVLSLAQSPVQAGGSRTVTTTASLVSNELMLARSETRRPTSQDQGESRADVNITAKIRKAVVKDDSLSVRAQNIKIITRKGVVTLRGEVDNAPEANKLLSIAKRERGVMHVNDELEMKKH